MPVGEGLSRLDEGLYRLLHHRSVRAACRAGRWEVLGLAAAEAGALASVDLAQIEQLAAQLRTDLLDRQHRGSGSLLSLYPETIGAWRAAWPGTTAEALDELAACFMESDAYAAYHGTVAAVGGLSLEEAFFRFCTAGGIGPRPAREKEFLTAMARALAVNPRPAFSVPAMFRRVEAGWLAVAGEEPPRLYAAVQGRLLLGPLTPFLADLLRPGADPHEVARRHEEDTTALRAALHELSVLGLMDGHG